VSKTAADAAAEAAVLCKRGRRRRKFAWAYPPHDGGMLCKRRRRKIAGAYLPLFGGGKWHKSDEVQRRQV